MGKATQIRIYIYIYGRAKPLDQQRLEELDLNRSTNHAAAGDVQQRGQPLLLAEGRRTKYKSGSKISKKQNTTNKNDNKTQTQNFGLRISLDCQ